MLLFAAIFLALHFCFIDVDTKVWNPCDLADVMREAGVPEDEIPIWLCITKHEADNCWNSSAGHIPGFYGNVGMFQIDPAHCDPKITNQTQFKDDACDVKDCDVFWDDAQMETQVKCAMKIKSKQSWTAWGTSNSCCKGDCNKNPKSVEGEGYMKNCTGGYSGDGGDDKGGDTTNKGGDDKKGGE